MQKNSSKSIVGPEQDNALMRRCLELAARGSGAVAPNPLVGALLVRDGAVVAEGFHERFGGPHAEVNAISALRDPGALDRCTLYVNLEPCSHFGKTAPCADLIIKSGIPRVVVGTADIFEEVRGRGIAKLRDAGIEVREGILAADCLRLNRRFFTLHGYARPYIILKWAQSADGFMARSDRTSKWISSEQSRRLVHEWRAVEDAVLVGSGTARDDDPALTVRMASGRNPLRVVLDRNLSLPRALKLFDGKASTLVLNSRSSEHIAGAELAQIDLSAGMQAVASELRRRKISSLIVEGGAQTLAAFIAADLWDEARIFTSGERFGSGIAAPRLEIAPVFSGNSGSDLLQISYNHWLPELIGRQCKERGYTYE